MLFCSGFRNGLVRLENIYADFVLRFEYRISLGGISRTFLRTNEKSPSVTQEIEIQLLNDRRGPLLVKLNGGVYNMVSPRQEESFPAGD